MKETRFNIGMNTLKQIDGLHGEEVYNTIQEISPAIAVLIDAPSTEIYTRPNLNFKERELITLASLLTLGGCEAQLKVHTNAALNVGIAPEQIIEVCTHCIPYSGFPRVLNALFTVKAVFEERNVL